MAKNRKTVRKGFTYLQCDDFADYLSKMAAQGWHFKEWGAGLVFEKGEPEEAVYAVEVFFKGSSYDLRPSIDTLDFADYCEQAGWQLIDSRQKLCVFKRIHPDAVPIATPQERIQNASKAYSRQLWWQVGLAVIWILNMCLRFVPASQFILNIFSNLTLVLAAYWIFYFAYTIGRTIWFTAWKRKAKRRCASGETAILNQASEKIGNWLTWLAVLLFTVAYSVYTSLWHLLIIVGFVFAIVLMGIFLSKLRPDRETNIGIQVIVTVLAIIGMIIAAFCIITYTEKDVQPGNAYPLQYEDFVDDVGEIKDNFSQMSTSIFGTHSYYSLHYEQNSLTYELYETEQNWILDIIWDEKLSYVRNSNPIDCTELWDAYTAYHNQIIEYYVRYDDAILILSIYDDTELTQEQIAIIRDALGLEG